MRKKLFTLLLMTIVLGHLQAATSPIVSTSNETVWYFIQFLNGENVLAEQGDGNLAITAVPTNKSSQLWKIEGDANSGYSIISKTGLTLYLNNTNQGGKFYAASAPVSNTKMGIVTTTNNVYSDGFEIQPKANSGVSMNQWEGAGTGKNLGLWSKGDGNNPLIFVTQEEFQEKGNTTPIIPYPSTLNITEKGGLKISELNAISYPSEDNATKKVVEDFATQLAKTSGANLTVQTSANRIQKGISLVVDSSVADEGYTLEVDNEGVLIKASKPVGFFYAIQTLKQLLPREFFGNTLASSADWTISCVSIEDQPQLEHRGFMLDIARHFFDKTEVKKIIDLMSLYKMNRLHWHLTDDQGWRVEIPEYPLLTEVGSVRAGSFINAGGSSKFFDDTEYGEGLWYSLDDLREIVAYAKERHIEIIPEIDLPGHMVAAVSAYPEFSCDPTKKYSVRIDGGISHDVLNIGKDEVIDFLKIVLGHIADVFPCDYIHLGGDECPTGQWSTNADCLKRVKDEGLSGVNELQSWLVELLGTYLKTEHNKDIVVWDELLSHWSSDNTVQPVIMAWNNIGMSSKAADKGFKSIVVPYQYLYIDFMQVSANEADVNEIYQGGWGDGFVNTVQSAYNFNPLSALSGREDFCLGVQCNMWTETCSSVEQLEYQLLPRLLAVAETGWLPAAKKSWLSFYTRLQSHDEILEALDFTYAKHYIEPKELTAAEEVLAEAKSILDVSIAGAVGYPSVTDYNNLNNAFETLTANKEDNSALEALSKAIADYKAADIILPQTGKIYQIVSASTYYKKKYVGSVIYEKNDGLSFHYTPQIEPEELWQFVKEGEGYVIKNYGSGKVLNIPAYNQAVALTDDNATLVRVDKATLAAKQYDYVPGAVTISAVEGYSATVNNTVKRLFGNPTGQVFAIDDPMLCNPGTWYIVEVTDFKAQLEGLLKKCERIVAKTDTEEVGQPSQDALDFLSLSLVAPLKSFLGTTNIVSEQSYLEYVAIYNEFLAMPRSGLLDSLSETNYYYIRNAYFTNYYAKVNASTNNVEPKTLVNTDDSFRWNFKKNSDGTVTIFNKATKTAAFISSAAADQTIKVNYKNMGISKWYLAEVSTDLGNTGYAIMNTPSGFSWYTNPSSFSTVLTKPYDWGASIWTFQMLDDEVITGINEVKIDELKIDRVYDISGRPTSNPTKGLYISGDKKILIK
ncbi:N-acetyl-beta-hexosaminidase [Dysgonomonadaceae bacterium PH5-43]|nr:N-acetyl-beta-hexosaminidase [Dysgonomonadaceae bacterium PH5-43]